MQWSSSSVWRGDVCLQTIKYLWWNQSESHLTCLLIFQCSYQRDVFSRFTTERAAATRERERKEAERLQRPFSITSIDGSLQQTEQFNQWPWSDNLFVVDSWLVVVWTSVDHSKTISNCVGVTSTYFFVLWRATFVLFQWCSTEEIRWTAIPSFASYFLFDLLVPHACCFSSTWEDRPMDFARTLATITCTSHRQYYQCAKSKFNQFSICILNECTSP